MTALEAFREAFLVAVTGHYADVRCLRLFSLATNFGQGDTRPYTIVSYLFTAGAEMINRAPSEPLMKAHRRTTTLAPQPLPPVYSQRSHWRSTENVGAASCVSPNLSSAQHAGKASAVPRYLHGSKRSLNVSVKTPFSDVAHARTL